MMIYAGSFIQCAASNPTSVKNLLEKNMKNKFTPHPKFASSPICIEDADFDFSIDLSLISTVEADQIGRAHV